MGSFFSSFIYLYIIGEKSIWMYGYREIDKDKRIENR